MHGRGCSLDFHSFNKRATLLSQHIMINHPSDKVLTYIGYRAVSGVFRSELLTLPPLYPQRVCPHPAPKAGGGGTYSPGGKGVGFSISEDARHWIGLLQYNPYTTLPLPLLIPQRVWW
jgi:hypothetical protein